MRILILEVTESDNVILEDVFELLSDRTGIRVVDLSHESLRIFCPLLFGKTSWLGIQQATDI